MLQDFQSNEENSNLFAKAPTPKKKAKGASITNVDYWRLVCEVQEMVDAKMNSIDVNNSEEDNGVEETKKQMDIWKDETCIVLLFGGTLDQVLDDVVEIDQAKKRLLNYHWREDTLFFKDLVVPKPKERHVLVKSIHKEIGHFSERKTLAEVKKRCFWHDETKLVRMVVRQCQHCQLAKSLGNIRFGIEEMKSIPICDLFYRVALDIAGPLPKTKNGNGYVSVAIDHYSKWCEAQPIKDHDVAAAAKFLEEEIICRFGMLRFNSLTMEVSGWLNLI